MSEDPNLGEARRWLGQALHDRDAACLNRDHGFHEHACFVAQQSAEKALKAFLCARGEGYIAARYPNGLPAGIPHDFYDRTLADQALADLEAVLACVQRLVRS